MPDQGMLVSQYSVRAYIAVCTHNPGTLVTSCGTGKPIPCIDVLTDTSAHAQQSQSSLLQ